MGGVKRMLPDDWGDKQHDEPSDEEIWFDMYEQDLNRDKYLCIGNEEVEAKWLPRWYGVPHTECAFTLEKLLNDSEIDLGSRSYLGIYGMHPDAIKQSNIIRLPVLPKGSDYKQKLKELKLEKLLNGNDIR